MLSSLHRVKLHGSLRFSESIQIAQVRFCLFAVSRYFASEYPIVQLALKHRNNKSQDQKIVAFVGSPLEEDEADLKRLALRLKKNKVAVDVVNFGEEALNSTKLEVFIQTINSGDNSHLVTVPAGPHILSDILVASPIIGAESVPGGIDGIDPNLDPELALALRLSLEESQRGAGGAEGAAPPVAAPAAGTGPSAAAQQAADKMDVDMGAEDPDQMDEDEGDADDELAKAIAMSVGGAGAPDVSHMSEEEALQLAMQMSMQVDTEPGAGDGEPSNDDDDAAMIESAIQQLPGVDINSPEVKALIESLKEQKKAEQGKK